MPNVRFVSTQIELALAAFCGRSGRSDEAHYRPQKEESWRGKRQRVLPMCFLWNLANGQRFDADAEKEDFWQVGTVEVEGVERRRGADGFLEWLETTQFFRAFNGIGAIVGAGPFEVDALAAFGDIEAQVGPAVGWVGTHGLFAQVIYAIPIRVIRIERAASAAEEPFFPGVGQAVEVLVRGRGFD